MELLVKKLHPGAKIPTYATDGSGNFDLYAVIDGDKPVTIEQGERAAISIGLAFEVPPEWMLSVYSRSGHGFKNGVRLSNSVGQIDSDYRGCVMVSLHNDNGDRFIIRHGDRIAQARLEPAPRVQFVEVDELSETARGEGGFGSSGQ